MYKTKIILLLICFASIVSAQNWNAILNVTPYPSPYTSDWETNPSAVGSLTLFNNTNEPADIIITATVTHHSYGVVATSITSKIQISSAASTLIDNTIFFNSSNSQFPQHDLEDKVIRTGRLPEGQYTVCLNIKSIDNQILVNNICADFTIVYPEPPHLVYPMNDDSLNADNEYPTFQWTPVIVPPDYQLTYTLKIVEVFQGQTPAQALSANYPLYINNQINITSITYPIDALKLENGKTYSWQIQALDQFGLPPTQNQGKSEIFTFIKKKFIIFPIFIINNPLLQSPSNNNQIASNKPTFKWSYTPAEGENYKFGIKICAMNTGQSTADAINNPPLYSTVLSSNQTSFTPPVYLNFSQNAGYVWRVDVINASDNSNLKSSDVWKFTYSQGINPVFTFPAWSFLSGQLRYKYAYNYDTESWSLANRTVKLVIKYIMKYTSYSGTGNYGSTNEAPKGELILKDSNIPGTHEDNNKTLAVAVTDANGNFNFYFINPDSMKLIKANYHISTSGEFGYDYTGDIYRVARVIVEDQYFTSPDDDIIIQPYETKNIGSLTSSIRSYTLEVTIKPNKYWEQQFTLQPLDQMDVYLLRKKRPYGLPDTEGSPKPSVASPFPGYEVVAMGTTEGEPHKGKIIFTRLISNIAQGDNYYIYARSNKNAPHNYILFKQNFYFSDWHRSDGKYYRDPDKSGNTYYSKNKPSYSTHQDNAIYNSQYKQTTVHRDFKAFPLLPEISGLVVRSDEPGTKINNATVQLMKKFKTTNWYGYTYTYNIVEKTFKTDAAGKFYFGGLKVERSSKSPYEINGPVRQLRGSAEGFDSKILDVDGSAQNNALSLGERKSNQMLVLKPGSIVSGNILDEYGNGLDARIKIGDTPEKTVYPNGYYYDSKNHKLVISPAHFEFPVARLKHRQLIVTPLYNTSQYIIDTTYVDITQSNQNLGNIIVYEKKHRMKFIVKKAQQWTPTLEHPSPPVYQWPPLLGAKIKINLMGSYSEKTTNQYGEASFKFSNDAESFKVIVEGPANKYYVKKVGMIQNKPSKYDVTYIVVLDKATYISGSVFVAGNQPVENTDVWIDFGNPDLNISVKTDETGEYILPNVPIGQDVIVYASKHSNTETIIGDSAAVSTTENGKTGVNLYLTVYNGMDITHLLGFDVLLTHLTEEVKGQIRITGLINKFKKNNIFSDPSKSKLSFKNVLIKPGNKKNSKGVPYAALASPSLIFNNPSLSLNVFKKFNAHLGDTQNGIQLINPGNGIGLLKGKLFVNASSFDTKGSLSGYNGLYLANPDEQNNTKKMLVPAITADGSAPLKIPKGFNVTNSSGGKLTLKINNFNSETNPNNSFFNRDTVRLRTTLHTNIAHANPSDLKLPIGDVVFHQKSIDPLIGKKEFSFKLDNWTLDASEWNFYKGNIKITKGILNAGLNIPVKTLDVTPTSLAFGDFNLSSITVSKIVPFTITGKFYFNHDDANDYWYLSVSKKNPNDPYSSYAKGLPGMANNDLLKISSFVLNSKESFFSLTPENQTLKIYKVGILNLNASNPLLAYDDYLYVQGIGFNIPDATQSTAFDYYKGKNGKIAFKLRGINLSANAGNGVYIKFGATPVQQNSQVLDESGFRSIGVVGEEGKFEKVSWLYHTVDSTSILVETPTIPFTTRNTYQKMKIGSANSTYLSKLTGGMIVSNNKWNNFHFEGDLTGTKGITDKHKRLAFTVYGKILADNQQISVKEVPTPFGKMKWVYEFEKSRLIGTFDIHKNLGGVKIDATSEILIDNMGWYFLAGGTLEVPGIGPGYAAMIFGDYPSIPQSVKDKFADASYNKNLPSSFQKNISGFLFSGAISIPLIIPHVDINLGIVALKFGVDAGGDVKIYKGFDEGGSTYGISTLAFIHAFLAMGSITCTTLSGDATLEAGIDGNYHTGTHKFNLNGCASFKISGHLIQLIPDPLTLSCGPPAILDIGDTFAFSARFHVDSQKNISLKFKTGTCSGN